MTSRHEEEGDEEEGEEEEGEENGDLKLVPVWVILRLLPPLPPRDGVLPAPEALGVGEEALVGDEEVEGEEDVGLLLLTCK